MTAREMQDAVRALHDFSSRLAIEEISDTAVYNRGTIRNSHYYVDHPDFFLFLAADKTISDPRKRREEYGVSPEAVIGFVVRVARGTYLDAFGLARYPMHIIRNGERIETNLPKWCLRNEVNELRAYRYGVGNYLRAHLNVLDILGEAERLGILEYVEDASGYWNSRDLNVLQERMLEDAAVCAAANDEVSAVSGVRGWPEDLPDYQELVVRGRELLRHRRHRHY